MQLRCSESATNCAVFNSAINCAAAVQLRCSGSVAALADSPHTHLLLILLIYSLILNIFITICHQCYACTQLFWTAVLWQTKLSSTVCQTENILEGPEKRTDFGSAHQLAVFEASLINLIYILFQISVLPKHFFSFFSFFPLVSVACSGWDELNRFGLFFANRFDFFCLTSLIWTTESTVWRSIVFHYSGRRFTNIARGTMDLWAIKSAT